MGLTAGGVMVGRVTVLTAIGCASIRVLCAMPRAARADRNSEMRMSVTTRECTARLSRRVGRVRFVTGSIALITSILSSGPDTAFPKHLMVRTGGHRASDG